MSGGIGQPVDFQRHNDTPTEPPVSGQAGSAVLTRVTGELHAVLRELRMAADALLLPPLEASDCTAWTAKLLSRQCHRGTWVFAPSLSVGSRKTLAAQGFDLQRVSPDGASDSGIADAWTGRYNPLWEPKQRGLEWQAATVTQRHCIVIGAGLAGACTANALAARGWDVQVLDAAPAPAMGASSLPVGLMVAHTSVDDNPRSRLTRAGVQMATHQARRCLGQGVDWDLNGVLSLKPGSMAQFHVDGAWVKPQALVRAWMAHAGIRFTGSANVTVLEWRDTPAGGEWRVLDAHGRELAAAPHVVLAAAVGCSAVLHNTADRLCTAKRPPIAVPKLTSVPGQVSWGFQSKGDADWAPAASVNGRGYLAANLPIEDQLAWLTGSTFEDDTDPLDAAAGHAHNFSQLLQLLPGAAAALRARFETRCVNAWRNVRCTTADRLPVAGPITGAPPGLWLNTGYGARGLTWSVLCAELLAARLNGEPWPIAASLAGKIGERRSLRG